jgi:hypothetical protein
MFVASAGEEGGDATGHDCNAEHGETRDLHTLRFPTVGAECRRGNSISHSSIHG